MGDLIRAEPSAPLVIPYFAYLVLLAANDFVPAGYLPIALAVHTAAGLYIVWLFHRRLPAMGRPYVVAAILAGLLAAFGWVAGQYVLNDVRLGDYALGDRLFFYPGERKVVDPHDDHGGGAWFGFYAAMKITRACTVVPIVEELFWRGFVLRLFVSWNRPHQVPFGTFTWLSFLGSSLLSTVQHPDNWAVSIGCWMFFNALFIWRRSFRLLIIAHAVTNLSLYLYVLRAGDWQFW
jgi:hypothetical protein